MNRYLLTFIVGLSLIVGAFAQDHPEHPKAKQAEKGIKEKKSVPVICGKCGQIKGADVCCKADTPKCKKCGLAKGSPGCCKLPVAGKDTGLCTKCGQIKGTDVCCKADTPKCKKCGLAKDSPGCCKLSKKGNAKKSEHPEHPK